jgi:hypothetical protein
MKQTSKLEEKRSLQIDKRNNPSGDYNNCKYIHSKCQQTHFHKGNTTGHKTSNRPQPNNSG